MRLRVVLFAAVMVCIVPMVALPAHAETIGFSGSTASPGGGTFGFTPAAGASISVSNALIQSLLTSFGACNPSCAVSGGLLNLTSGGQIANPVPGLYIFGAGGTINITGGIAALGIAAGSSLLSATFLPNATFNFSATSTSTFGGNLNLASIMLNPAIGTFTYIGGSDNQVFMNVKFAGGTYSGDVFSSNVAIQATPISEPASLSLIGVGLIGFAALLRRGLLELKSISN